MAGGWDRWKCDLRSKQVFSFFELQRCWNSSTDPGLSWATREQLVTLKRSQAALVAANELAYPDNLKSNNFLRQEPEWGAEAQLFGAMENLIC